jgi:D-glycero-D-manno-heptose 1,7-bisphosphate phosphatase
MSHLRPAVFLDRDGTLIVDKHYLHRPEEVEFFPGVAEALRRLQAAGFALVVITNQSGVGRGLFTLSDVDRVHEHIAEELGREGVRFEGFYSAPEAPDQPSRGRKPSPQFLFDARDTHGLDLSRSFMVGDKVVDLEAGWNAGVSRSFLVRTGYGAKVESKEPEKLGTAVVVDTVCQVADWILARPADAAPTA